MQNTVILKEAIKDLEKAIIASEKFSLCYIQAAISRLQAEADRLKKI